MSKKLNIQYVPKSENKTDILSPHRTKSRPTSPHIGIYKWEWTMIYSILHRAVAFACLLIAMLAVFIVFGLSKDTLLSDILLVSLTHPIGVAIQYAILWTVFYFLSAEIKYAIWGSGKALDLKNAKKLGTLCVLSSFILSTGVFLWFLL